MRIPFFDPARAADLQWPAISKRVDRVLETCRFVNGPLVAELEQAIAERTGAGQAVAVGSGTDALIILLRAAGVGAGDNVVVPCFSFFATASSVVHAGATPRFAEIDPATYNLDPARLAERVDERTAAIMPVHLFRQLADMAPILEIAARHGVPVIEDSAEAMGMTWRGRHAGLLSLGGVLSFFPSKTLGAVGDAGMILTDDADLAARCRLLRNHGQDDAAPYVWHLPGFNSRVDDLQAAVLLARMETLDAGIERRAELVARYDRRLAALHPMVGVPRTRPDPEAVSVHYVYVIEAAERDRLVDHLEARGIGVEVYYPLPLHLQPCFAGLGHAPGDFPVAERASTRTVALPLYPELADEEVELVCAEIEAFYADGRGRP